MDRRTGCLWLNCWEDSDVVTQMTIHSFSIWETVYSPIYECVHFILKGHFLNLWVSLNRILQSFDAQEKLELRSWELEFWGFTGHFKEKEWEKKSREGYSSIISYWKVQWRLFVRSEAVTGCTFQWNYYPFNIRSTSHFLSIDKIVVMWLMELFMWLMF